MKRFLSVMLVLLMLASAASVPVGARIIYYDDFENGKNEEFWGGLGKFVIEDGVMTGWSDAVIAQSNLRDEDPVRNPGVFADMFGCFKDFTLWMDIILGGEAEQSEYGAGYWITDTRDMEMGYAPYKTIYNLFYMVREDADGEAYSAFARLFSDSPTPDENYPDNIYGELELPEVGAEDEDGEFVPGFNYGGEVVRIGLRFGQGNITGYANGKIVASYDYSTIGHNFSPILIKNSGCYVELDNFYVGSLDEDVKKHTRNDSYTLDFAEVSVSNGVDTATTGYKEDDTVTVTAPAAAEPGKVFDRWQMKIGGRDVSDAPNDGSVSNITITPLEAAKLLHGIEIGNLSSAELTFTMPDENVELTALYRDGEPHAIKVNGGSASTAEAVVGTTVTVTADAAPGGKVFDKWEVVAGGISLADANAAETTFTMADADVEITAAYKDKVIDVTHKITVKNGTANVSEAAAGTTVTVIASEEAEFDKWEVVSGGVTLADAKNRQTTFVMGDEDVVIKAVFLAIVGDANGDGRVNAKDIIAVMRHMLGNTPADFVEVSADADANGKINAKDIIAIMREMLEP